MRKNSREDWNKPIQELIHMMNEDYPNGYELVITTAGAEIRSTLTDMVFTDDSLVAINHDCLERIAIEDD